MLTRPARLHGAASRSVARGLRLLACQLLVQAGVAAPQDEGSLGLVPRSMARRLTNVKNASELVAAVEDESVGTIVVAAGTYKLTSKMSGAACSPYDDDDSALCIRRNLTIRAENNGTVVLDATKQTWRVIYVGGGGRLELVGLNITGGVADIVRSLFEPAGSCAPAPCWSARFLLSGWRSIHRYWWRGISYLLYHRGQPGQ